MTALVDQPGKEGEIIEVTVKDEQRLAPHEAQQLLRETGIVGHGFFHSAMAGSL